MDRPVQAVAEGRGVTDQAVRLEVRRLQEAGWLRSAGRTRDRRHLLRLLHLERRPLPPQGGAGEDPGRAWLLPRLRALRPRLEPLHPEPLPPALQEVLAFAVEEGAANLRRHGQAGEAWLGLAATGGGLDLWIEDAGRGPFPEFGAREAAVLLDRRGGGRRRRGLERLRASVPRLEAGFRGLRLVWAGGTTRLEGGPRLQGLRLRLRFAWGEPEQPLLPATREPEPFLLALGRVWTPEEPFLDPGPAQRLLREFPAEAPRAVVDWSGASWCSLAFAEAVLEALRRAGRPVAHRGVVPELAGCLGRAGLAVEADQPSPAEEPPASSAPAGGLPRSSASQVRKASSTA